MWFRATKPFEFTNPVKRKVRVQPGQLVFIGNRHTVAALEAKGSIAPQHTVVGRQGVPAPKPLEPRGRRILVWCNMNPFYSGGRIHLYQYALALAQMGHQVTFATTGHPPWQTDYPASPNMHVTQGDPRVIRDIDLVVADGKNALARKGLAYAQQHGVPFVIWSFETPNWVKKFRPDVAERIAYHNDYRDVFRQADLALTLSDEGAKYLREWIGQETPPIAVVRPIVAFNEQALGSPLADAVLGRRYAVCVGRAAEYKNDPACAAAVWAYADQLDLVKVGHWSGAQPKNSPQHRLHIFGNLPNRAKWALLSHADAVLAPSDFEGFGMVPGEALCAGTTCIVYDLPVLREEYGDSLEYVPRRNVKALSAALRQVVSGKKRPSPETVTATRQRMSFATMQEGLEKLPYHAARSVRISVLMNAYACEKLVPFALRAIYNHVHEIIISYGREEWWPWPADNTLAVLRAFPDPQHKIRVIAKEVWPGGSDEHSRRDMREAGAALVTGNYLMILDADEIWTGLEHYSAALRAGALTGGCPLGVTFWHDGRHTIRSAALERWGLKSPYTSFGAVWPHCRLLPWRASYFWRRHVVPVDRATDKPAWTSEDNRRAVAVLKDSCVLYHLGHCLPRERMEQKKAYYEQRDGHAKPAKAWLNWNGKLGECGDGIVERVTWPLPAIVKEALDAVGAAHD